MKKILTLLLALTMVVGLFAGCGGNKDDNKGGEGNGKPTLTIGIPANANVMSYDENALTNWLEEQLDCNLEFMVYSGGSDIATQISTTVAAMQPLPDVLWDISLGTSIISQYGEDGYFLDLAPYFYSDVENKVPNTELMPNFWMRYNQWDDYLGTLGGENWNKKFQDEIDYRMTEESGAIYSYPVFGYGPTDSMIYKPWINKTWLDKLGLPMPTSAEELYETLKAFKANDCNGNGINDEIPFYGCRPDTLGADAYSFIINMFGYWDCAAYWLPNEDGTLQNAYTADHYRTGLQYLNKLYKEGLMTPLTVTGSSSEMKRLTTPSNGVSMVGLFIGHLQSHILNGSEVLYEYVPLPMWFPTVEKRCPVTREIFITTDCPEENRELAIKLLDLMQSEEGALRVRYGKLDVDWKYYEGEETSVSGNKYKMEVINEMIGAQNSSRWSSALTIGGVSDLIDIKYPATEWYNYQLKITYEQYQNYMGCQVKYNPDLIYPGPRYTAEEEEQTGVARENCITYVSTSMTEFITGIMDPYDDSQWNAYLAKLDELGFQQWKQVSESSWARILESKK